MGLSGAGGGHARAVSPKGSPLPQVLHQIISREAVCRGKGSRLILVGDVHGCAAELKALLEQERFDRGRDTLVLVGDLVNKGPCSQEVIRLARETHALCVRGNHDEDLIQAYRGVGKYEGGLKKYKQRALYEVREGGDPDGDMRWLEDLPLSLSFPWMRMVVVHAGLVPGVPLEKQRFEDLLWIRDLKTVEGERVGTKEPGMHTVPWAGEWRGPELVVFGHDSKRMLQQHAHAIGLDTGCCKGHELTALILDPTLDPHDPSTRRFASVKAKRDYRQGGDSD